MRHSIWCRAHLLPAKHPFELGERGVTQSPWCHAGDHAIRRSAGLACVCHRLRNSVDDRSRACAGGAEGAISQSSKSLEVEHSRALFDCEMRPLRPNAAGSVLLDQAAALLEHAYTAAVNVRAATGAIVVQSRLGCVDSFAAVIGRALLNGLMRAAQSQQS